MNADTITERINNQSDEALKREIERMVKPLKSLCDAGCQPNDFEFNQGEQAFKINVWTAFEALKQKAFDKNFERRRRDAISEFMAKVESLSTDIEELRNSIPQ